jgi:hypothetical protein
VGSARRAGTCCVELPDRSVGRGDRGENKVRLEPSAPCDAICDTERTPNDAPALPTLSAEAPAEVVARKAPEHAAF